MGSIVQSFSLALILGTGCLGIGECELTQGHWHETKAANSRCNLYGRKAGSKLLLADRANDNRRRGWAKLARAALVGGLQREVIFLT